MIGNFLVFHCMISNILFKAKEAFPGISEETQRIFQDIGAVIYHIYVGSGLLGFPNYSSNQGAIKLENRDILPNELPLP